VYKSFKFPWLGKTWYVSNPSDSPLFFGGELKAFVIYFFFENFFKRPKSSKISKKNKNSQPLSQCMGALNEEEISLK